MCIANERKVFVFGREGINGEDENLGLEILVTMFESLVRRKELPVALVFWNTAVRLLTDSSPVLRYLKPLEEKGVAVLAGKLCLQELEISHLAVGRAVTMDEILDLFQAWDVVNL